MKKILLSLLVLVQATLLFVTSPETVRAQDFDISWSSVNTYSTNHILLGTIDIPTGAEGVKFQLPDSSLSMINNFGQDAEIIFYDNTDTVIDIVDWYTYYGYDLGVEVDIYFELASVLGAVRLDIIIPQSYGSTPSGYVDYIDTYDTVSFYYELPSSQPVYFRAGRLANRYLFSFESSNIYPADGFSDLSIYTGDFSFLTSYLYGAITYESFVTIYDKDNIELDDIFFKDMPLSDNGYLVEPEYLGYTADDIFYFRLTFYVFQDSYSLGPENINEQIRYVYDLDLIEVVFYDYELNVHDTDSVLLGYIPDEPTQPTMPEGKYFKNWVDINGDVYDFTAISENQIINNQVLLYPLAYDDVVLPDFTILNTDVEDTGGVTNLLASMGFLTQEALSILYVIILIIITIILVRLGVMPLAILFILGAVTFFFMFMNYLHVMVGVFALILLGVATVFMIGGSSNE